MTGKTDDTKETRAWLLLVAIVCMAIGIGLVWGAGYGWMSVAMMFAAAIFADWLEKR